MAAILNDGNERTFHIRNTISYQSAVHSLVRLSENSVFNRLKFSVQLAANLVPSRDLLTNYHMYGCFCYLPPPEKTAVKAGNQTCDAVFSSTAA